MRPRTSSIRSRARGGRSWPNPSSHVTANPDRPSSPAGGTMKTWFVADNSLSAVDGGLELDIRLPWYRSLPLSALDFGAVAIDGAAIDPATITVDLNEQMRPLP